MKVVFLFGSAAVGKMTVGQELMKLTGLRLFHNHMTIEPVLEIFGSFESKTIQRLRQVIFEDFAETDHYSAERYDENICKAKNELVDHRPVF